MLALKITDKKDFTNKLFLGDTFDLFWLNQAEITTSNLFTIIKQIAKKGKKKLFSNM